VQIYHAIRFGDVMRGSIIDDVFGIGIAEIFMTFHQNIGALLSFGALAAMGLASNRVTRIVTICALAATILLSFHIAARTALVALVSSLLFWGLATWWSRSKRAAALGAIAAMVSIAVASGLFYHHALHNRNVDPAAPDALSRTIREVQDPNPGFRMQIWARTLHHVVHEPQLLLFGRGIGMYPVNEGLGAPDWLLHRTEGSRYYPHNAHLEILYEMGIAGLLLYAVLTFFPLIVSLRYWHQFSSAEKSIVTIYVFNLVSSDISGAFAPSYQFQFFFALSIGIIAMRRTGDVELNLTGENLDPRHSVLVGLAAVECTPSSPSVNSA
jgi:O-antigen ligase